MLNRDKSVIYSAIIVCFLATFTTRSHANEFDREKQALSIISDFADKLCRDASDAGKQKTSEIKAEGKVSLNSLLSKIAGLGFKGTGNYQVSEYEGLLQRDLKDTFKNTNDCRIQVLKELNEKLLSPKKGEHVASNKVKPAKTPKYKIANKEQANNNMQESLNTDLDYFIKNFSDIDLNLECNDNPEYMNRYRQAQVLLDVIEAKAKKTKNTEILETIVSPRRQGIHRISENCSDKNVIDGKHQALNTSESEVAINPKQIDYIKATKQDAISLVKKDGKDVLIHESIAKLIYNYEPSKPVYVAYGEPNGCGPEGNVWMQNSQTNVSKFELKKENDYFRAYGMLDIQFQIVQLKENKVGINNVKWARLEKMSHDLADYYFNGFDCTGGQRTAIWVKK